MNNLKVRSGCGVLIVNECGEIFLQLRGAHSKGESGSWALPGGKIEEGETGEQAAIREIKEELGVEITLTGQFPSYDHIIPEKNESWITNVFTAKIISGIPKILEPEKCSEIGWFALTALPTPIATMSQKALEYLSHLQK